MKQISNKFSGLKRLFIALSICWSIISLLIAVSAGYDRNSIFVILFFASSPVWLGWLIYWVYLGFKNDAKIKKTQISYNALNNFFLCCPIFASIKNLWFGKAKLWQAYWIVFVGAGVLIGIAAKLTIHGPGITMGAILIFILLAISLILRPGPI